MATAFTPEETASIGPLAGVRVLELGSFIAGPFAGQLLGDYGADVLKIEPPGAGDPMRTWGITRNGESLWWPSIARNKRSVAIDMREQRGRDIVKQLIGEVDVVLENFRPGRLEEWDMGYEQLAAANPGVIVVHVSGFGQTGPRAAEAGFGSIGEAVGGIRFTTGAPELPPSRSGISLGDSLAALFAVIGTMAALNERHRSGRGQEVDVAIYEAVAALMESSMADFEIANHLRTRTGSVLAGVAPSNVYPDADGGSVILAANADAVYRRLCGAMGRPDLATDERFATHAARGANMTELDGLISAWTSTMPSEELLDVLAGNGVPAGKIFTAENMLADEHYAAREMVLRRPNRDGTNVPMTGIVPKFVRTPGDVRTTGPLLGEHTEQVLRELVHLDDAALATLRDDGIIQTSDRQTMNRRHDGREQ
jgi:formyl-CoA transferase/succinyl-CoA--D-citramalate CoA-transferase